MSAESEEIAYKRLSFEDLLFTSYVYKRNFRNRFTAKATNHAASKVSREPKGRVASAAASIVSIDTSDPPSLTPGIVKNKQSMSIDSASTTGFEKLQAHRESPLGDSKRVGYYSSGALAESLTCPNPVFPTQDSGITTAMEGFDDGKVQSHDAHDPLQQLQSQEYLTPAPSKSKTWDAPPQLPELDPFLGDLNRVPENSPMDLYVRNMAAEFVTLGSQRRLEQLSQTVPNENQAVEELRPSHLISPEQAPSIIQASAIAEVTGPPSSDGALSKQNASYIGPGHNDLVSRDEHGLITLHLAQDYVSLHDTLTSLRMRLMDVDFQQASKGYGFTGRQDGDRFIRTVLQRWCCVEFAKACYFQDVVAIDTWIKRGFQVNSLIPKRPISMTVTRPLHFAAEFGRTETAKLLIARGVLIDEPLTEEVIKCNSLRWPFGNPQEENETKEHSKDGDNSEVADTVTREWLFCGFTPLHIAVARGQIAMVELLLNSGAAVDLKNFDGQSSMHLACKAANVKMVKCLVRHGASLEQMCCDGFLPIHLAVTSGSPKLVRYLCGLGVNLEATTRPRRYTPLQMACSQSTSEVVDALLGMGARAPSSYDVLEWTHHPLGIAVFRRNSAVTKSLLTIDNATAFLQKGFYGTTILHEFVTSRHSMRRFNPEDEREILRLLLSCRGLVSYTDNWRRQPLHLVAAIKESEWGSNRMPLEDVIQMLVTAGAEVHANDMHMHDPLYLACREGAEKAVKTLLACGAGVIPRSVRDSHYEAVSKRTDTTTDSSRRLVDLLDNAASLRQPHQPVPSSPATNFSWPVQVFGGGDVPRPDWFGAFLRPRDPPPLPPAYLTTVSR
jgi:ankyrin repeat protein